MGESLRRWWWLVGLLALGGAVAGVIIGVVANPRYSSTSELLVGSPNATAQAVPGYVQATQSLAASYSRAAESAELIVPSARAIGLPPAVVSSRLSVSPVPSSNIITVVATGPSAPDAQRLARVASRQLILLVQRSQALGSSSGLLKQYRNAASSVVRAQNRLHNLQVAHVPRSAAAYTAAETAIATAQVQAQALSTEYIQAAQNNLAAAGIQILDTAGAASSNRTSTTQKAALVGLLSGVLLGAMLAFLLNGRLRSSQPLAAG